MTDKQEITTKEADHSFYLRPSLETHCGQSTTSRLWNEALLGCKCGLQRNHTIYMVSLLVVDHECRVVYLFHALIVLDWRFP